MYEKDDIIAFAEKIKKEILPRLSEGTDISIKTVEKNNGMELVGLMINEHKKNGQNANIAPVIYVNGHYEDYMSDVLEYDEKQALENICSSIIALYENSMQHSEKLGYDNEVLTDINKFMDNICFKVINTEMNKKMLAEVPHVEFNDLSIVFIIIVSTKNGQISAITVNNSMDIVKKVTMEQMLTAAIRNTEKKLSSEIVGMGEMIAELGADQIIDELPEYECQPYVATNKMRINGAGIIMYKNLLKKFSDKINSSFYIIPSSIHELLFIKDVNGKIDEDINGYKAMVYEVNHDSNVISKDDFLSNSVYYYNRDTAEIEML